MQTTAVFAPTLSNSPEQASAAPTQRYLFLRGLALYALAAAILSALIFAVPGYLSTDDYYHARISEQFIVQGRLRLDFPWLPMTILSNAQFVDHHLLFHLYAAPWIYLGGEVGVKLATVSIAAGVIVAAWAFLRQIGVQYAMLWALGLLAASSTFLYRMLMVRTQGAALLLVIIALMLVVARRDRWLLVLAFAYAWLYNGFVLLIGVVGLYALAVWIAERRILWKPVVYTVAGIGLGLVINPYFPANLQFIFDHLSAKVDFENGVRVGNEWYPYSTSVLLEKSGGALLLLALGVLRPSFRGRRRDAIETALLLIAFMTLFMLLRSRRFIEYFPAFGILFGAAAWGRIPYPLTPFPITADGARERGIRAYFQSLLPRINQLVIRLLPVGAVAALLLGIGLTFRAADREIRDASRTDYLAGASAWLRDNSPAGSVIFQTDWDDFTRLFYYNPANIYTVGLDPTYLQLADPALWDEWVAITRGEVAQPSTAIRERFGAAYVVSDQQHDDFAAQADADPGLQLVYRDDNALVWQVVK
jgi:hypothetical protein